MIDERKYILAGNYEMLDRLYAKLAKAEQEKALLVKAMVDLITDAQAMDKRLLVGQPAPGCEKGSIARARNVLRQVGC